MGGGWVEGGSDEKWHGPYTGNFSRLNKPELSTYFINFDEPFPFPAHERDCICFRAHCIFIPRPKVTQEIRDPVTLSNSIILNVKFSNLKYGAYSLSTIEQ